ncbi:hypothetical protein [Sphingomonas sp. NFX23]|uniref:hypothetical protein n=1 Tax=Sphingomonas sp. NFX23 TaxID=2819532 RepID=UPI003CEE2E97
MATQPLYQSHSEPVPLVSKSFSDRALLAPGLAAVAVERTAAVLPVPVRETSLDEITITEMATSLISLARSLLSAEMYSKFLAWGIAAALFASEYDAEGDALCARTVDALTAISSVPAWRLHDFMLKAWLFGLEVCDSPQFGPLSVRSQDSQLLVMRIAEGVATDLSRSSPIVAALQRLASFAGDQSNNARGFSFTKPVGDLIAAAFSAAQQVSEERTAKPDWDTARASMESIQASVDGHPGTPEPEFNRLCSRLADAQIALLTTPAPTAAELAFKQKLYFEIDAHDFEEASIGASITADVDRLMCSARQPAGAGEPDASTGHLGADPHTAWLANRNRAQATINSADETLTDEAADALSTYTVERDDEIANTSATTRDGVLAKLALIAQISLEGWEPNMDWCASALVDAQRVAGIGSLAGAVEERHREMAA